MSQGGLSVLGRKAAGALVVFLGCESLVVPRGHIGIQIYFPAPVSNGRLLVLHYVVHERMHDVNPIFPISIQGSHEKSRYLVSGEISDVVEVSFLDNARRVLALLDSETT